MHSIHIHILFFSNSLFSLLIFNSHALQLNRNLMCLPVASERVFPYTYQLPPIQKINPKLEIQIHLTS